MTLPRFWLSCFLLVMASAGCSVSSSVKFSYGDKVRVVSGFYRGCVGRVNGVRLSLAETLYSISAQCPTAGAVGTQDYMDLKVSCANLAAQ